MAPIDSALRPRSTGSFPAFLLSCFPDSIVIFRAGRPLDRTGCKPVLRHCFLAAPATRAKQRAAARGFDVKRELELIVPGSTPGEESEKLPEIAHTFNRTRRRQFGKKKQIGIAGKFCPPISQISTEKNIQNLCPSTFPLPHRRDDRSWLVEASPAAGKTG
jgi:hypothetical protein